MRIRPATAVVLFASLALAGCSGGPDPAAAASDPGVAAPPAAAPAVVGSPTDVVATVGGVEVLRSELDQRLSTLLANDDVQTAVADDPDLHGRLASDTLNQMIEARLVTAAADDLGVRVDDAALQAHIDDLTARTLGDGPDAWAMFLRDQGYPEAEIREQLREGLRRDAMEDHLVPTPVLDPAAVQAAFDDGYAGRPVVSHILVEQEEQAETVFAELTAGADFAELAATTSIDTASAAAGGTIGIWNRDDLTPSVDRAVETADDGELIGPVSSPFGWHVLYRAAPMSLDQARPQIEENLRELQQDAVFAEWVQQLRAGATVDVAAEFGRWDAGRVQR